MQRKIILGLLVLLVLILQYAFWGRQEQRD
jgi:regulatory protein YycH of two-component signal transduction system YycFG